MRYHSYDPAYVAAIRTGAPDANGQPAEKATSPGPGTPCRACLRNIDKGEAMLILAARPFPDPQPYAETGPIFLHADACTAWQGEGTPPALTTSATYLIKGYTADHRICYGTGAIVPAADVATEVATRLAAPEIAFVDIRSATNNCFLTRATGDARRSA